MISERSTVTTVMPEPCSNFSLNRMVWNAPVRAPIDADTGAFQSTHDAADTHETIEVRSELLSVDVAGVARRVGEGDVILIEVVGDRKFAAESVAAAGKVDLVDLIVAGLQQNRDAEPRLADKLHDRDFVAEIRQANDEAVDRFALGAEMFGVAPRVLARLHGAVFCRVERQDAESDAQLLKLRDQLLTRLQRRRAD